MKLMNLVGQEIDAFSEFWETADIHFIERFIVRETAIYNGGEYVLYQSDNRLGITIITDTTERSPTFSLYPFENENEPGAASFTLLYLYAGFN